MNQFELHCKVIFVLTAVTLQMATEMAAKEAEEEAEKLRELEKEKEKEKAKTGKGKGGKKSKSRSPSPKKGKKDTESAAATPPCEYAHPAVIVCCLGKTNPKLDSKVYKCFLNQHTKNACCVQPF